MKSWIASALRATGFVALFVFTTAGIPTNGIPTNGIPTNGIPTNGIPTNGIPTNGIPTNGASLDLLEKTLIFGNASVHNALISKPFTAASLTNAQSPLFQIWSDPASALLASYLWQDVHPLGDDFTFTTPSGITYRFYGNVGACVDANGHGWGRDTPQDLTCAKWVSALIITQINQSGIHNIFSARGPSSTAGQPGFIGNQLTDMAPAMHSFDYKFGTHDPVEALRDPCPSHTTGPANCGWQPGIVGVGTPGTVVKISVTSTTVVPVPMIVQVNQGIMGHNHPLAPKGSCFGKVACTDPDVLGFNVDGTLNPTVTFTIPPSHIFNVQWTTFSRDALASRVQTGNGTSAPTMTATRVSSTGDVHFPGDELDIFPARNREMTASGNIFGATNIDPALFSCEVRPVTTAAGGTAYTITPVVGPPGAIGPESFGLNDAGQIVGSFLDSAVVGHGFLQNPDGTTVIIDFPGASRTEARGINNSGQIVGTFNDVAFRSHGFLRNVDGSFVRLDMPFATTLATEANGINDAGQIVGSFNDGTKTHGFSRTPEGTFTSFDVPGAIQVSNRGIDSHGNTVGFFVDANNVEHGFVQRPGATLTVIDLTGAVNTTVGGINDSGQIVGGYFDGSQSHGFAMAGPVTTSGPLTGFTVLDDPRVFPGGNSGAAAINNLGAIVGTSQVFDFEGGFLATLAGVQLCSAATPFPCKPCSRNFTPGATRVIFPNAHMWLSNSWTSAQSYYRARSCSSDLSTCIANFEGLIDASWVNPVTRRTVPACQVQNADSDTYRPLPYPAPPRTLHDANSCFVDRATMPNFAVTTFFPNFGSLGSCSALPVASVCGFTTHRPVPDDDNDD